MKEDLNIEELFQEKFNNFEANVDPSAWANISQGIGAAGAGGAGGTGLSGLAKVAIISGVVAVTSVSVWYFTKDEDKDSEITQENIIPVVDDNTNDGTTISVTEIVAEDNNDPLIENNEDQIRDNAETIVISNEDFDQELIDMVLLNENTELIIKDNNNSSGNNNVSDNGNDQKEDNDPVVENVDPVIADVDIIPDAVKCDPSIDMDGSTLSFNANAENHDNVQWHFGDGEEGLGENGSHTYERPGTYTVTMTVQGPATAMVREFEVTVEGTSRMEEISNIFTPNGDGRNDEFRIEAEGLETFLIVIYDINGSQVFQSEDPDFSWNGEKMDGSIEAGNYIYKVIAEGEDGAIFKDAGTLQIVLK